ncbi:MAG: GGDEF domain-containing protein [Pseudomonadota bacterium]
MVAFDITGQSADVQAVMKRLMDENAKLKKQVETLSRLALQDELTGLLNRRGFLRALDNAIAFSRRYEVPACLTFVDLDGFKAINDEHGHAAGDIVLQTVGQRLTGHVRSSDIVARLGGDEFVVLLWSVTEQIAERRTGHLLDLVFGDPVQLSANNTVTISASAGVASVGETESAADLVGRADEAMYVAKARIRPEACDARNAVR